MVAALKVALDNVSPRAGCIHHSDRGVQYACREYITLLEQAQLQISMSRTANPYDNAHMESFFKTLKYEEVHLANYETYDDVSQRIPHFIEEVYNSKRLHSAWGIPLRTNTRWRFNQLLKLPVAPPSNLGEISPAEGAQSSSTVQRFNVFKNLIRGVQIVQAVQSLQLRSKRYPIKIKPSFKGSRVQAFKDRFGGEERGGDYR